MAEKNLLAERRENRVYWNAFAQFRLTPGMQKAVLTYFDNAVYAVLAKEEEWQRFFRLAQRLCFTEAERERIRTVRGKNHVKELERLEETGINFVTAEEEQFPERLRELSDAPRWLYYIGSLPKEDLQIAVIGARKCTPYGSAAAWNIAGALSEHGVGILSGLAYGVDKQAHEGALAKGGKTYAVLGCGVDICYPECNRETYERILCAGGGILSEYPPGTPPLSCLFPQRNRIIAGLSDGILVAEAKKKSGSMITVSFGLEYGKNIYSVPGRITDVVSEGCNYLIREGAKPVLSAADILEDFEKVLREKKKKKEHKSSKNYEFLKNVLATKEKIVYASLRLRPKHIEEIQEETKLPPEELPEVLQSLCEYGCIKRYGQAYYGLSGENNGFFPER
ncbi:MAG: DNA-processing protein DprA [Lachnospiraceae bacterium]|nr:DNA-processing protein DprA [Lachnospiraceae bacterium]